MRYICKCCRSGAPGIELLRPSRIEKPKHLNHWPVVSFGELDGRQAVEGQEVLPCGDALRSAANAERLDAQIW